MSESCGSLQARAEEAESQLRAAKLQQQILQNNIEAKEFSLADMQAILAELQVSTDEYDSPLLRITACCLLFLGVESQIVPSTVASLYQNRKLQYAIY